MSSSRPSVFQIFQVGAVSILLAGCGASYQEPPKATAPVTLEPRPSTIMIPIVASLDDLQGRLNAAVPNPLAVIDEKRDACVPAKWARFCVIPKVFRSGCAQEVNTKISPEIDCKLNGAATRGDISLAGSGNTLTLGMPVAVQVTARGTGDIGKHIRETANGAADVVASVAIDIDENWTPSAQLNADYAWTERLGVNVLGFRITFASKADEQIKEALADFQSSLPSLLQELDLKGRAQTAWDSAFTVLRVNEEPPVWMRFTPEAIGFSGLQIVDRVANASLLAQGRTEVFVGPEPEAAVLTPLPPLRRDLPAAGFEFRLPVLIDYKAMVDAAKPVLNIGTRQEFDVGDLGKVGVTIRDLNIRPTSDGAVAIGVTLKADPPSSLFDTDGVVWLVGTPAVDNESKSVRVSGLELYGITDNQLSDILVRIMQLPPVTTLIESALQYDFSAQYEAGLAQANAAFTKEVAPGVVVSGSITDATVDAVVPGPDALYLELSARGSAAVNVGAVQ